MYIPSLILCVSWCSVGCTIHTVCTSFRTADDYSTCLCVPWHPGCVDAWVFSRREPERSEGHERLRR